jgi:hypothetical protein
MLSRWEYLVLEANTNYGAQKYVINGELNNQLKNQPLILVLNQVGAQGYEMVNFSITGQNSQIYVFKRPRTSTQSIQPLSNNG